MKYDKSSLPRLDDKYEHQYYRSQSTPNGTADLIICDRDSQVIAVIEEALFPSNTNFSKYQTCYCDGESVIGLDPTGDDFDSMLEDYSADLVESIDRDFVLSCVAHSPVKPSDEVIKEINKALRKAV